jgi:hypothetical protein
MARGVPPKTSSPWRATLPTQQAEVVAVKSAVHLVTLEWHERMVDGLGPSIVRVVPTPEATQQERDAFKERLLKQGALHVTFAAVTSRDRVVTKRGARTASPSKPERFNDALLSMLLEARTQDRERLRVTVERFLGKAGA